MVTEEKKAKYFQKIYKSFLVCNFPYLTAIENKILIDLCNNDLRACYYKGLDDINKIADFFKQIYANIS